MSEENECKGFGLTREMLERCREESLKPPPSSPVPTIRVEPEDIDLVNRLAPTMGYTFIPIDEYLNRLTGKMDKRAFEMTQEQLNEQLFDAVHDNSLNAVKKYLEQGADVNARDDEGRTPLHISSFGHIKIANLLLEQGADINAKDDIGHTPLHEAASETHTEMVKLLIEKGADVNARSKWGTTPLHEAAEDGHIHIVELLLEKGADVNAADDDGETPLDNAANRGHTEVVELLKQHGDRE